MRPDRSAPLPPERVEVLLVHPSAELYGSDRVLLESVAALHDAGRSCAVVLAGEGPLRERIEQLGVPVAVLPVPVLRKSVLTPRGLLRFVAGTVRCTPAMLRVLRRRRPRTVYVSTVTVPWWLLVARAVGSRVVCHVHEAEADAPRLVRAGLTAPLLAAHRVLANSRCSAMVLTADVPGLAGRTEVVYNGVAGPVSADAVRAELSRPVRLVQAGRISERKGTDVAVAALALLVADGVDATLDVVGGVFAGNDGFERRVRATAVELGVADRVRWRGVLAAVWPALAEADVVLVASRVEPFGNAAVEAMLARRPVVAGDTQGLREIVRPGRNGELAAPGDPRALADAVRRIVDDWPAARERAERAAREAAERFGTHNYRLRLISYLIE